MNNKRRTLCILLAFILLMPMLPPIQAANTDWVQLSMSASQTEIPLGDVFSLTLGTEQGFATRGAGMTILYDPAVLEPILPDSRAAEPFQISNPIQMNSQSAIRISFLPGMEVAAISAGTVLAEIRFRALTIVDQTTITMGDAYFYDASLNEITIEKAHPATIRVIPFSEKIPVTGIALAPGALTLEEGRTAAIQASIFPENATDQTLFWETSDPNIVTVSDGKLQARSTGQAIITATTNDGGFSASCVVTVAEPAAGYAVEMPADQTAVVGEKIAIPLVIRNSDRDIGYNAFDIHLTYDPKLLRLETTYLSTATITDTSGQVHIIGYGESKPSGTAPFVLEFVVIAPGESEILLTDARVDHSGNATVANAAQAALWDDRTVISVEGYSVRLPEGFVGAACAKPDEDYTFQAPDDAFDYAVTVTIGGTEVEIPAGENGCYTIPKELITGQIVVTATNTGKIYSVTLGTDLQGSPTAQHAVDYIATLNRESGYKYSLSVTIGGREYNGFGIYGDEYRIPGGDIIGDIVFTVIKTSDTDPTEPQQFHAVTFTGSAAGAAEGNPTHVIHGGTYILTLLEDMTYSYQVFFRMGDGEEMLVSRQEDGTYRIQNVTAPLEIRIEKTLNVQLSVHPYVDLDRKTMFLVLVDAAPEEGRVFTFDGNPMYYSESYGAWAYLLITDGVFPPEDALQRLEIRDTGFQRIQKPDCDVNGTGLVDINDAQLVYDIYNGKHEDFNIISMVKFLNADTDQDKRITVKDAAIIAANLK